MTQITTFFTLLTFYKFVDVTNPQQEVAEHFQFCNDIGMKGRVYIGEEWISATMTGNIGQIQAYKLYLAQHPLFSNPTDIDTKATKVEGHCFDRMIVKYRPEIVALWKKVNQAQVERSRQEIDIEEFKKVLETGDENYAILDMRNTYEYKLGHFKGAIPAGTNNFREVQQLLKDYKEKLDGKKVVMYCTGGIRCEKLAVLLKEEWVENFYSLDGWVVKYVNSFNDWMWLGNLYTFDGRVSTPVGDTNTHQKIARCIYTDLLTDNCENCRYTECNARIICRKKQYKRHLGFCSQECFENAKNSLLIKNIDRDQTDYKAIRSQIKRAPALKEKLIQEISEKLNSQLGNTKFPHQTSQKEELVDSCSF